MQEPVGLYIDAQKGVALIFRPWLHGIMLLCQHISHPVAMRWKGLTCVNIVMCRFAHGSSGSRTWPGARAMCAPSSAGGANCRTQVGAALAQLWCAQTGVSVWAQCNGN